MSGLIHSAVETISEAIFSGVFVFTTEERRMTGPERQALQEQVDDLARRMGIQKSLQIFETGVPGVAQAMGGVSIPGRSGVAIDTDFHTEVGRGQKFVLAHEIAQ